MTPAARHHHHHHQRRLTPPRLFLLRFPRRVKAKKGVNLLQTRSKHAQWRVDWEVQSGAKHSITTINVNKSKVKQG